MKINNQDYCDECKRTIDQDDIHDCIWVAKDGREYCDHCYDQVFYPKYYGFTRTEFKSGQAGYIMGKDGKVIKIHKGADIPDNKIEDWLDREKSYYQEWEKSNYEKIEEASKKEKNPKDKDGNQ